jgi:hypothetical protein
VGEDQGAYVVKDQAEVIAELLRLFTLQQLSEICAEFEEIAENGYGSITIEVDGGWVNLLPTPSRRIGRLKKNS